MVLRLSISTSLSFILVMMVTFILLWFKRDGASLLKVCPRLLFGFFIDIWDCSSSPRYESWITLGKCYMEDRIGLPREWFIFFLGETLLVLPDIWILLFILPFRNFESRSFPEVWSYRYFMGLTGVGYLRCRDFLGELVDVLPFSPENVGITF